MAVVVVVEAEAAAFNAAAVYPEAVEWEGIRGRRRASGWSSQGSGKGGRRGFVVLYAALGEQEQRSERKWRSSDKPTEVHSKNDLNKQTAITN